MPRTAAMFKALRAAALTVTLLFALAGTAQATDGTFSRAIGFGVDPSGSGGSFDVCTVAAQCVAGTKGSAGGEFKDPEGVATDAAGNMWVAETNGQRIDKLDPSGKFLLALGKNVNLVAGATNFDVCTVAQSCQPATAGTRDGQFDRPRDIATDPAGDVYVADFLNGRVQKFDPTGRSFRCSAPVGPVSAATSYCRPASRPTHRAISTSPRKQATESRSSTPRAISCLQ